jgi:hypothetical protein
MTHDRNWLVPLTGLAFAVFGTASAVISGQPEGAEQPVDQIVGYYVDNKDTIQLGVFVGAAALIFLVFFGSYLRQVLREAGPDGEILSLVSFAGVLLVVVGFAIDGTITIALSEAAPDIDPVAVQSLQALWDNDFVPLAVGVLMFLWATGLATLRSGALPRWLGWVMIALGVIALTPLGWAAATATAILVPVLSVLLALRARSRQRVNA